jgi:hypothetical protein
VYYFNRYKEKGIMKKVVKNKVKKASSTTSKARKTNKKKITQTHGKVEKENDFVPTTLDQIWGDTGMQKYKTMDPTKYESDLRTMAKVDLQAHASRVGIVPVDNREVLSLRLIREFKKHVSLYKFPQNKTLGKMTSRDQLSAKAKRILDEGK